MKKRPSGSLKIFVPILIFILILPSGCAFLNQKELQFKVSAAAVKIAVNDSLPIGGWIVPRYVKGIDAPLRAQSVIITDGKTKVCLVSCDVITLHRDFLDDIGHEVETMFGIPFSNIMFTATHTHGSPFQENWTNKSAGQTFNIAIRNAIMEAIGLADKKLYNAGEMDCYFATSYATLGQNSRVMLEDSTVLWIPSRYEIGYNRPTGPFDSELPVLAFKDKNGKTEAIIYNHSSHNIGSYGNGISPCIYGHASQEIEKESGGIVLFLPGAFGSTHIFDGCSVNERVFRIKEGIKKASTKAETRDINHLASVKKEFEFKIRTFNEDQQQDAVAGYCNLWISSSETDLVIQTFKNRRNKLALQEGDIQKSWLQVALIGDIAFVAVPGELFAELGMEIKRRSPFRYTYIVGIANDYIGYLPDREAYCLGGYQTWAGPCIAEPGTGEKIVNETVSILNGLYQEKQ